MRKRSSRKIIKNPNDVEKDNNETQRRQNNKQGERRKDNAQTVQRSKGVDDGESDSSSANVDLAVITQSVAVPGQGERKKVRRKDIAQKKQASEP